MAEVRHLGAFPFCIEKFPPKEYDSQIELATGPFSNYPFTLKKNKASDFWWRVKKWNLSFVFEDYIDRTFLGEYEGSFAEASTQITLTGESAETNGLRFVIEDEKGLVCLSFTEEAIFVQTWSWSAQYVGQTTYPPDPETGEQPQPTPINYTQNYSAEFCNQNFQQAFSPLFVFSEDQDDTTKNADLHTSCRLTIGPFLSNAEEGVVTSQATATIKMFDNNLASFPIGMAESAGQTTTISDVVIEASEYFEYDPNDGLGPIYDKNTGAKLRFDRI